MNEETQSVVTEFLKSLSEISWLDQAGVPHPEWVVVADIVEGHDCWGAKKIETWTRYSHRLEMEAKKTLADSAIDEIFAAVSHFAAGVVAEGLQLYYDRRPVINESTAINADRGLWPEVLDDIKRDIAWAAVESVLHQSGFFTSLLDYYRAGRWPCSWSGEYPAGKIVVL